jgi:alpha-beta hydrolase superfamily lysophospholipase
MIDAQTALDYLLDSPDAKDTHIFVYGQSLGGALAIQLTAKNQGKIAGLILENTFKSMRTLIPSAFPPAKYLARLCHQIWPSETTLPLIENTPTLFLSGLRDELVP